MRDDDLDRLLLTELPKLSPAAALREAVLSRAPKPRLAPEHGWWWHLGAGWAAAAVAGLILGVVVQPSMEPAPSALEQVLAAEETLWPEELG